MIRRDSGSDDRLAETARMMRALCTPEGSRAIMVLTLGLLTLGLVLQLLALRERKFGKRWWLELIPGVAFVRTILDPGARLGRRGFLYWKLYHACYVLALSITLAAYLFYLPACIAFIKASN